MHRDVLGEPMMDDLLVCALVVLVTVWLICCAAVVYKWSNDKERDKRYLNAVSQEPRFVAWVRRDDIVVLRWMPTYYGEDEAVVRRCTREEYPPANFDLIVLGNNEYPETGR